MSEDKVQTPRAGQGSLLVDVDSNAISSIVEISDFGMIGSILQSLLDFLNSPAFATIVQIIQQIVQLIIGAFSLLSFLGYHGFQDEVIRQYISATSFFVATTQNGSNLFATSIHLAILLFNVFTNDDTSPIVIDWRKIILQIILWIVERLLRGGNGSDDDNTQVNKQSAYGSVLATIIKLVSIFVCLRFILA